MDSTQAKAILGMAMAYFPVPALSPATEQAWGETLMSEAHEYALQAVKEIGRAGTPRGAPFHISMVLNRAQELRREANQGRFDYDGGREALEAIVPASEEEKRAILARYWDTVGQDRRNRAMLVHSVRNGDADARIDAARDYAARRIEESAVSYAEGAETPPRAVDPPGVLRTACGAQAGEQGIQVDGVWCCPRCRSPLTVGCLPPRANEEEA
jgi:hypothetical protein